MAAVEMMLAGLTSKMQALEASTETLRKEWSMGQLSYKHMWQKHERHQRAQFLRRQQLRVGGGIPLTFSPGALPTSFATTTSARGGKLPTTTPPASQ